MVRKYKRKRIIRKYKREKSYKDRLKNFQKEWEGFVSLDDFIKVGKYKGRTWKWIIAHDIDYMQWAYNIFEFDKEFKDYYEEAKKGNENYKEQKRKEEELRKHKEKQRRWYDSKSERNTEWNDFFNRFSHGNYKYEHTQDYHHQQSTFSPAISEEKKHGTVLGLQGKVKKSEIKNKYLIALKKNHPDHWEKGTELEKKQAHLITIQVIEAWKFFKNKYAL